MKIKKTETSMERLTPIITAMLKENIDVRLKISGNSMYPMLTHKRDTVILTRCQEYSLNRGDIPLYRRNDGRYVLHRIIRVNEHSYDLCGDNQYIIEKNVPKENIIAVVKAFERNGKLYNCNNLAYQIYLNIIIVILPFRYFVHRILNVSKIRGIK